MYGRKSLVLILVVCCYVSLSGWELSNKLNINGSYNHNDREDIWGMNLNYYPGFEFEVFKQKQMSLDCFIEGEFVSELSSSAEPEFDGEIYRMWLRSMNPQSEFRIGLQKISFGPAVFLRSLQWFDKIDPRDSRQQTEGVWAVLLRYYLVDNSNFWFWGIYNEKENEYLYSKPDGISGGGRMQLPLLGGEIAISYYQREIGQDLPLIRAIDSGSEQRYGFDGRWDYFLGFWVESSASVVDDVQMIPTHYEMHTFGCDYTFNFYNGIHLLGESMITTSGDEFFNRKGKYEQAYVISADTPIGMYDDISGFCLYNSVTEDYYYYLSYGLTFDYIKINLNVSISPEEELLEETKIGFSSGKQIELKMQIDF